MFHEIAVEPTAIRTLRDIQFVLGLAGFSKGRLIADYPIEPKNPMVEKLGWASRVVESIKTVDIGKATIIRELLIRERKRILKSERNFDDGRSWIVNARAEHSRSPFAALILDCPATNEFECNLDDFLGDVCPECLSEDQHVQPLPKRPAEFAEHLLPMLRCASALRFVDPHYLYENRVDATLRLSSRHARVAEEIARKMNGFSRVPRTVEFHMLQVSYDSANELKFFIGKMKDHLPKAWKAKAFLWREKDGGRRFHARYILTDVGGVGSEYGLDEGRWAADETDIYLLPEPLRARRTADFAENGAAFSLAAGPLGFSGTR